VRIAPKGKEFEEEGAAVTSERADRHLFNLREGTRTNLAAVNRERREKKMKNVLLFLREKEPIDKSFRLREGGKKRKELCSPDEARERGD